MMQQYIREWVQGEEIKWDNRKSCFADTIFKVANWRDLSCDNYKLLYKFGSDKAQYELPFNY